MSSSASQHSGNFAPPNRGGRCRVVRATPSCAHCQGPVRLDESKVARLGAELRLEVTCPGCERAFTLSLTPPTSPAPGAPSGAQLADTAAAPPRKAKPPFRPLLGASPQRALPGSGDDDGAKVAPFAPLPADDTPSAGDQAAAGPRGKEPLKGWWKRLSTRQQKTVLATAAAVVVLAVLV